MNELFTTMGLTDLRHLVVATLVVVGTFFLVVGTVGLLRLPNVYNRMHATSKPTTLGTVTIFLAGFVNFGPGNAGLTALVGIVFLLMTVPTGAHMISRAAQKTGVPFLGGVTWPANRESDASGDGENSVSDDSLGDDSTSDNRTGDDSTSDNRTGDDSISDNRTGDDSANDDSAENDRANEDGN